jgi:hypothetical protein
MGVHPNNFPVIDSSNTQNTTPQVPRAVLADAATNSTMGLGELVAIGSAMVSGHSMKIMKMFSLEARFSLGIRVHHK